MNENLSAKRYEPTNIDLDNNNNSQKISIDFVGSKKKILEIGTSTGYVSKILKKYENNVTGIEIDQEAGLIAQQYCDQFIIGDVELLNLDEFFVPETFDVILCGDIIEHLKKPADFLKRIKKYLRPDGYLVVSLPNFCHGDVLLNLLAGDFHTTSRGLLDETHLHFFGLKNIYSLFASCGYEIRNIRTTNLSMGNTELKVDPEKIPKKLFSFINSLPNSDVYQFVFTAHPLLKEIWIPPQTEPDIQKLAHDIFEEPIAETQSESLYLQETIRLKDQHIGNLETILNEREAHILSIEADYGRLQETIRLKDQHIGNLEAILAEQKVKIREILDERRETIHLKDTHITNLETILNEREAHILSIEADYGKLQEAIQIKDDIISHLETISSENVIRIQQKDIEIIQLNSAIEDKERHIGNIEEALRLCQRSFPRKIIDSFFQKTRKYAPAGTKRRRVWELLHGAVTISSTNGISCLLFRIIMRMENFLFYGKKQVRIPFSTINILGPNDNVPFSLEQEISGVFRCPMDGLNEIQVLTATHCRLNRSLIFQLKEFETGITLRTEKIRGCNISNNGWTGFPFAPVYDSRDRTFLFSIQSKGTPAAVVWLNPGGTPRELQLSGKYGPIQGLIGFRCFTSMKIFNSYDAWILTHEPKPAQLEQMKIESKTLDCRPKISIITPVWNVNVKWLRRAIESVLNQVYENWELCMVDGGSTNSHIRKILNKYANKDSRIKIKFLDENKGIAGNSNEALSLATGNFIGFLDHDDELSPFALYEVVKLINQKKDLQFIYSDEDKIDERGIRISPFFKPDWSPDLFLSVNFLCHFSVIRAGLLRELHGFREGYDGSQDHDLFLRVTEHLKPDKIAHIPKILYHWRTIPDSVSSTASAKLYAFSAGKKAIRDSLERKNIAIEDVTDGNWLGSYRVRYKVELNPEVAIIIPTRDKVEILERCINSILEKTSYRNYTIFIVDNQSQEEKTLTFYDSLKGCDKIRILHYNQPFNYSAINNYAVNFVQSPYILFLNNDTEVISPEWLTAMLEHAQRDGVGAVGAKLLYPNNTIQHAGVILGIGGNPPVAGHSHKCFPGQHEGYFGRANVIQNVSAVTAACLLMKRELFNQIGGFEEELSVAFNDVDLCLKIRHQGYLIVYTPFAELYHYESLSRGSDNTPESKLRSRDEVLYIREKWGDLIDKGDPYYNPNLTLEKEDFSISWNI